MPLTLELRAVILLSASSAEGDRSGSSSGVERKLPKLDVAGSIPVSRSISFPVAPFIRANVPLETSLMHRLGDISGPIPEVFGSGRESLSSLQTECPPLDLLTHFCQ